jgi:hypothetical protein
MKMNYGDRVVASIEIQNLIDGVLYRNLGNPEWQSMPLPNTEKLRAPRPWSSAARGLTPYPYKVALLRGQSGSLSSPEGLDAWIYSNETGTLRLLVPDLNFFPVVQSPVSGFRRVFHSIVIGEVPTTLFNPPDGAPIKEVPAPQPGFPGQKPR